MQVGSNVASSSSPPAAGWKTTFMLENEPLPVTSTIRNWAQGKGGQIAQSLEQALQLPNDVKYFASGSDEALVVRLQWHTIAVLILSFSYFLLRYSNIL